MLESKVADASFFVTLTYAPETLPRDESLVPQDITSWVKRMRKRIHPLQLRYYLVGEYGDDTARPHYHVALFVNGKFSVDEMQYICSSAWSVASREGAGARRTVWNLGFTLVGPLTDSSSAYVAGYVTKKMTSHGDIRLKGRYPEFARMSRRPGIGTNAMARVAIVMQSEVGLNEILRLGGNVPTHLFQDKKSIPLGRYLRGKLRAMLGLPKKAPESAEFVQKSYEEYKKAYEAVVDQVSKYYRWPTMKASIDMDSQKRLNMLGRIKLKDGKKSL